MTVEVINGPAATASVDQTPIVVVAQDVVETIYVGDQGPPGPPGPVGPPGEASTVPGPPRPTGTSIRYGTVAPTNNIGNDGDFYINTKTNMLYGPKTSGIWPAGTSLIGPQGPIGVTGATGTTGPQGAKGDKGDKGDTGALGPQGTVGPQGLQGIPGNTILYGAGAPASGIGIDGNFYIDTGAHFLYGPKAGTWPAGTSLIGPQGIQGIQGPQGIQGVPGAGSPSTTPPLMDSAATIGVSTYYARDDHIHPSDTSRVSEAGDTMTGNLIVPKVQIGSVLTMPADAQNILSATAIALPPGATIGFNNYQNISTGNKYAMAGYNSCIFQDGQGGVQIAVAPSGAAGATVAAYNQAYKFELGGALTVTNRVAGGNASVVLDAAAASGGPNNSFIQGSKGGLTRWQMFIGGAGAETGGNAGSDFQLYRFNDAGTAAIDQPFWVARSTGIVNVNNLNALGDITSQGTIHCGGATGLLIGSVSGGTYTVSRGWTLDSGGGTFNAQAYSQSGVQLAMIFYYQNTQLCSFNYNSAFYCYSSAFKPGGGAWADTSDARIKTVSGDYAHGLAEIEQLKPVRYKYKGNDTNGQPAQAHPGKEPPCGVKLDDPLVAPYPTSPHYKQATEGTEYIGLVAQDCEAILPELISLQKGTIDGIEVTDLRQLDQGPLVFALINAVKELSARVKALEATA